MVCFTNSVQSPIQKLFWDGQQPPRWLHFPEMMGRGWWKIPAKKSKRKRTATWCWPWSHLKQSVLFLTACSKASYVALLICKLGPPGTCFGASLPFPWAGGSSRAGRSGNGGIAVGWLLCLMPVLAPECFRRAAGLAAEGRSMTCDWAKVLRSWWQSVALATLGLILLAFWALGRVSEHGWSVQHYV